MRPACLPDRETTAAAVPPLLTLLGILLAVPAAAQVDTSEWTCEFCPFADGYRATLEAGADYVSDDALRFGNGSGYDEKGGYAALDGEGHYAKDGYQLHWFAEDLGLSSRVFDVDGGRQGRFDFHLGYRELPYRRFDSTSTVFSPAGADRLELPSGWVRAGMTGGFTALDASLRPQDIESDRNILTAGGRVTLGAGFDFHASYQRQERDGVDIVSGANYTQSSLLPRFLDFQTDLVDLGVGYSGDSFKVSLAWFGSFFDNKVDSLTWDNAFTSPAGFELRRMAEEPDNDFQQVSLSGSYRAPALDSVLSFSLATGRGTQDDSLLPYSVNAAAGGGTLPQSALNGKVDTTNYALTYTARPFDKTNIKLAYRYDQRDNKTPQAAWTRVITDTFPSGDSELNTAYSYKRRHLSASAGYRLFDTLRLSAGYDRRETDRDHQEVAEQTEDSGWGRIRWQATEWLDVDAKGGAARRDIGRYDLTVAQDLGQNPLLRKYNLAYRYREFGELRLSATPVDSPFTIGLSGLWADDSYTDSVVGMTGSETLHWNLDLGWTISDQASLYVFGGEERIDADQAASEDFGAPDWFASNSDKFRLIGGGLRLDQVVDKTNLLLDFATTDGNSGIVLYRAASDPEAFPDLESNLDSAELTFNYQHSDKLDIDLRFRYERFSTRDWALAGVEPDTIPTVLSLGAAPYDYSVWVVGVSFRYLIGTP